MSRIPSNRMLNSSCTITTPTQSQASDGTIDESTVVLTSNVQCAIQPAQSVEALEHQRNTGRTTFDLFVPAVWGTTAVSVTPKCRVAVGSETYEVASVHMDQGGRGRVLRVVVFSPTGGRT